MATTIDRVTHGFRARVAIVFAGNRIVDTGRIGEVVIAAICSAHIIIVADKACFAAYIAVAA